MSNISAHTSAEGASCPSADNLDKRLFIRRDRSWAPIRRAAPASVASLIAPDERDGSQQESHDITLRSATKFSRSSLESASLCKGATRESIDAFHLSTTLENEAIATLENEATQTDWMGDHFGRL